MTNITREEFEAQLEQLDTFEAKAEYFNEVLLEKVAGMTLQRANDFFDMLRTHDIGDDTIAIFKLWWHYNNNEQFHNHLVDSVMEQVSKKGDK